MKHLKTFEDIDDGPKKGDYVICIENNIDDDYENFISNNVGIYIEDFIWSGELYYVIKYENVPEKVKKYFKFIDTKDNKNLASYMKRKNIIDWSPSKEKLEILLSQGNYNL